MNKYVTIIYWSDQDNRYIVHVPELPGCMADGNTKEEALENAEIVVDEWLETAKLLGRTVPEPGSKPAEFYADLNPYVAVPDGEVNLLALSRYAKQNGKKLAELTEEEIKRFR